jgi:hypothetical protein
VISQVTKLGLQNQIGLPLMTSGPCMCFRDEFSGACSAFRRTHYIKSLQYFAKGASHDIASFP